MYRFIVLISAVVLGCLGTPRLAAQSEDTVKAAFLYNFAKFTEWPAAAFKAPTEPLTIGFAGADTLAQVFEQNVKGKNANGRDFAVKKLTGGADAAQCHVVYVGDPGQLPSFVAAVAGKPVLVISEGDQALGGGGMISFIKDGGKILFDLNVAGVNSAGLKPDPKLSKIARTVKGG